MRDIFFVFSGLELSCAQLNNRGDERLTYQIVSSPCSAYLAFMLADSERCAFCEPASRRDDRRCRGRRRIRARLRRAPLRSARSRSSELIATEKSQAAFKWARRAKTLNARSHASARTIMTDTRDDNDDDDKNAGGGHKKKG